MFRVFLTALVAMTFLTGPSSADGDYSGITIKRGYPLPADWMRLPGRIDIRTLKQES